MEKQKFGMIVLSLLMVCGCIDGNVSVPSDKAVSSLQTQLVNRPVIGEFNSQEADESTELGELKLILSPINIRQGASVVATATIQRPDGFEGEIALAFNDIPNGISIEPINPIVPAKSNVATINVTARSDAVVGDFMMTVAAFGKGGSPHALDRWAMLIRAPL
jgi:hypothetical protein